MLFSLISLLRPHARRGAVSAIAIAAVVLVAGVIGTSLYVMYAPTGEVDFSLRQKVSATAALRFTFPESMDEESVEAMMTIPDGVDGEWSWEQGILIFTPSASLKAGETYVFRMSPEAKKVNGEPFGRELLFEFIVAGPPEVSARLPVPGSHDVLPNSRITIIFDRPMIPLTQVQGEASAARIAGWNATITPAVEGRWRWMSTVAVEFIPAKNFDPATSYSVSVPKGLASVAGDQTEQDFGWMFETLRPAVLTTNPGEASALAGPTTEIDLTFNQEMDPNTTLHAVELIRASLTDEERARGVGASPDGLRPKGASVPLRAARYGKKEVDEKEVTDKATVVLTPGEKLSLNSAYAVYIAPGLMAATGNLGSQSGFTLHFSTVGDLGVESARYENNGIFLRFSNPLDTDSVKGQITVSPELPDDEALWTVNEWTDNREVSLYPTLDPSTKYTVTVGTGVRDAFGQKLAKPYVHTFTTPPLKPRVFIHSKGPFGIFERGKPPVYYVNAVNVSRVDVAFAPLPLKEFLALRQSRFATYEEPLPVLEGRPDVQTWTLTPKVKKDEWEVFPLDIAEKVGQSLAPGIYAVTAKAPEYAKSQFEYEPRVQHQFFLITNIALTLKYSGDHALVWATDMQTGNSVGDATIAFHSLNGTVALTGKTNAEGFFEGALPLNKLTTSQNDWEPEFWVTAEKAGDMAFVSSIWNEGIRSYDFGYFSDFHNTQADDERVDGYVYTERPIYRSGDTVSFKGIIRVRDWDGAYAIPAKARTASVAVSDPNGNEIYRKSLPLTEFGSFADTLPIDPKAALGYYSLSAQLQPETGVYPRFLGTSFSVLAYRKPEYRVDLTTEKEEYFDDEVVTAQVEGAYYFGAPMAGAKVVFRAYTNDYFFNKFTDGWYSFALEENWCWWECSPTTELVKEGEGELDAAGRFTVQVPVDLDTKGVSQILDIEADITDQNNQVVSNRVSVPVHKSNVYVGVRTDDYVVTPGSETHVSFVTVDTEGNPVANQDVELSLSYREWTSIRKKGVDGEYYYDNEAKDTFIRKVSARSDENGKGTATLKVDQGGEHRIIATTQDSAGRNAKAGTSVYAWSSTYVNWPHTNSDRVDVVVDKPEYKVGDTAKILVKSPFQGKGVHALVTVERENVISRRVVDIVSSAQTIEIPVTEKFLPNAFVSVVIVKPRIGETFNEHGLDTGAPAYKIGYAKLKVEIAPKRLAVEVTTDKKQYLPGEKVNVTLTAKDAAGAPAHAELSLGVVDMSVLALAGFHLPDLAAHFYSERGLGVNTAQMLTYLVERFKPGSKGGGGGDLEDRKRGNFRDTAFWQPNVITDANGRAQLSFTLPDNLTTWHLLAIGSTKEHTFGAADFTVIETKNVIVRPVRPRFAVRGDTLSLAALVHNFLPEERTFSVTLSGKGFTGETLKKEVSVKSGEQVKVTFPVQVNAVNELTLNFLAETEGARDEIEEKIPVHIFGTPQAVATSGITEDRVTEQVLVPKAKDAIDGDLTISISPSLATFLPGGLEYLVKFPYGCTEQTVSSFLPNVALAKLQTFDAFAIADDAQLEKNVTAGLERIYSFQRPDGGFGYWQDSEKSYAYLTAYVVYALQITRDAGFSVDAGVLSRARNYLNTVLRTARLDDQLDLATRANILFVLSEDSAAEASLLNNLYEQRTKLPLFAKAQLAMAFDNVGTNAASSRARELLTDIVNRAKVDARGTRFEEEDSDRYGFLMHTNDRTTAIVLHAMLRIDPENELIPSVVRSLLAVRRQGHWDTTQSTTHALLAFTEFLSATKELDAQYAGAVAVNGKKVIDWKVDQSNILTRKEVTLAIQSLKRGERNEVQIGKDGVGRLYYDLLLSYFYEADEIPPAEEGISILREMTPLEGQSEEVRVGKTYKVTLTMTVPKEREFVAVSSPLPAGMEIIDLSLQTSQKNLLKDSSRRNWWSSAYWDSGLWYFTHHEFRDDQLFLFADTLPAGVYQYHYLVRATLPGKFRYRPARIWEMYFPEVFGQTRGEWFTIEE
ncbi:MAG: Ig-like domain-containing protein [Candidatus Peregrinibacteria bacterium]|nr:Ig-like domain-containing protein [Candidatus Peregrinibacteria bacterium]